jgi:hypothetical protein
MLKQQACATNKKAGKLGIFLLVYLILFQRFRSIKLNQSAQKKMTGKVF